jgi:preprotein translocase subunit SecB
MEESKPAGYKVENILLMESSFHREIFIDFQKSVITNDIKTDSSFQETTPDNKFAVTLALEFKGMQDEKEVFSATIKMAGVFEKFGDPVLNDDAFKKINAPAIIYPFIREHLYSLSLKAGLGSIFLPTVNFKP